MIENIYKDYILIIDFGSQYTQLIAKRVRDNGVYCEIYIWNEDIEKFREKQKMNLCGIILSGGPNSTTEIQHAYSLKSIFISGVPILGICYGMQIIVTQFGGTVKKSLKREVGNTQVKIIHDNSLIHNIQDSFDNDNSPLLNVWMSHEDEISTIPNGFINIAKTVNCQFAAIANEKEKIYGVQFHPEVTHTNQGNHIFKRFLFNICHCTASWNAENIIENIIFQISNTIGKDHVLLGVSGGIDSLVLAKLFHKAIGNQLVCIFIDNGLLRLNEADQIMTTFKKHCDLNIIHVPAENRFLSALTGIYDPETKRKIIGRTFIEIFKEQISKHSKIKWLAQGTICPDIIESSVVTYGVHHSIKSHHNVGGLPENLKINIIEPLKDLFKDEIRKIGLELNLPYDIVYRHPFPGPGLGIRILGEVKKEFCNIIRYADAIFIDELHKENLYDKVSQAFTIFLPIRSVGIIGDNRKYDWIVSLRAIETTDFMTANWAYLPYEFLEKVSNRIINEVKGISRVVYDISGKPPSTIEWE